jgi:hypothetical protein
MNMSRTNKQAVLPTIQLLVGEKNEERLKMEKAHELAAGH